MDREKLEAAMARWLWRAVTPAVCVLLIGLAVRDAPYAYEAQFGSGAEGTFTVTHVTSGRSAGCSGDFVSDDGSTIRRDVALVPGRRGDVGDRIAAVDVGNPRGVYPADSAHGLAPRHDARRRQHRHPARVADHHHPPVPAPANRDVSTSRVRHVNPSTLSPCT